MRKLNQAAAIVFAAFCLLVLAPTAFTLVYFDIRSLFPCTPRTITVYHSDIVQISLDVCD